MRRIGILLTILCLGQVPAGLAAAANPDGTWMVGQRIAFEIYPCEPALCGRIVWLRNPTLRTPQMCGRVLIWGLTAEGPADWNNGWFFDPEDGNTYSVTAHADAPDRITARIYKGLALFGRTEILTRIASRSLAGWCEP